MCDSAAHPDDEWERSHIVLSHKWLASLGFLITRKMKDAILSDDSLFLCPSAAASDTVGEPHDNYARHEDGRRPDDAVESESKGVQLEQEDIVVVLIIEEARKASPFHVKRAIELFHPALVVLLPRLTGTCRTLKKEEEDSTVNASSALLILSLSHK